MDKLKYKLDKDELELLDNTWEFLGLFNKKHISLSDTRKNIIKNIRERYSPKEFLKLEMIANKLFWNLRWLIYPLWTDVMSKDGELPYCLTLCKSLSYLDDLDLKIKINKIKMKYAGHYYRSCINKVIIIDKEKKRIYYKPLEGSSIIFEKNYFNLFTSHIMMDRDIYETVISNPNIINSLYPKKL